MVKISSSDIPSSFRCVYALREWNQNENAGFTSGTPWIDLPKNIDTINVEDAISNKDSVLHVYRQLIKLRHHYDIITYGDIEPLYMELLGKSIHGVPDVNPAFSF
jgi:glycosidase